MPDGQFFDVGFPATPRRPDPPITIWPAPTRSSIIVDQYRVMLADPQGNLIGTPSPVLVLRQGPGQ